MHESLTPDRLVELAERSMTDGENVGVCLACGEETDGVEPDADNYQCDTCRRYEVVGAEQLLLRAAL